MAIADQYHDTAYGILYQRLKDFPELAGVVKTAELEAGGDQLLPSTAFAWPDERRYPIHTREHAALSYAYAKTAAEVPPDVKQRLENALAIYDVPLSVYQTAKVAAAPAEQRYALPDQRLLNLGTLEKSAEVFEQQASRLPADLRAQAAVALASEGVRRTKVAQYAGLTMCDTRKAADWLDARADAAPGQYKSAFQTMADGLRQQPAMSADRFGLSKLAAAIDELDREAGLVKHYDRRLPDPLMTIFNTEKVAGTTVDLGGYPVPVDELAKLSADFWSDLGGPELARELAPGGRVDPSKVAEVVETLPLDLKLVLRKQMGC